MSPTEITIVHAQAVHAVPHQGPPPLKELVPVTVTITPRMPVATAHAFSLPVVREIPPVQRPGMFSSTW